MKLLLRGIFSLIAITVFAPFASGQTTLYWDGGITAISGNTTTTGDLNFNTASNWSSNPPNLFQGVGTQVVPGPSNIAVVEADLNNGETVGGFFTGVAPVPVVINQTTQSNTVQGLIITNYFFNTGGGIVNLNNINGDTLTIDGTGNTNGDFVIDGGATLNYTGGPLAVTNGLTVVGDNTFTNVNTDAGAGTFNIKSGTFTFDAAGTATQMAVGYSQTGSGNVFFSFGAATGTVTQGSVVGNLSSTAITGSSLVIGYNGGSGSWNLTNNSVLETGTLASSYIIYLGSNGGPGSLNGTGASGILTISNTSTFNLGTVGSGTFTDLELGTTTLGDENINVGGSGTIDQNGTGSTVNFVGTNTHVEVGAFGNFGGRGGTGLYKLEAGTLNIGTNTTDAVKFTLGAEADPTTGFIVSAGSTGTLTQTGGTLNVGNSTVANGTTFTVGTSSVLGTSTGIYNMNGGIANFNNALTLNASGTLNLNGGILNIASAKLLGSGTLNFGGGTLKFTSGTTWTDSFLGGALAAKTTSTIDASVGTFTTVTINQKLTGGGGITLVGTDGTNGNALTTFTFNGANNYTGATTIAGGTLNVSAADIQNSSALNIDSITNSTAGGGISVGTMNLTLAAGGLAYTGAIGGNGNLNIIFNTAGDTFAIKNSSTFTGAIVLGATPLVGTKQAGNFQVYGGTFGNISDNGTGSSVTIGGALPVGLPNAFVLPTSGTVTFLTTTYTGLTTVNQNFTLNANNLDGDATVGSALLPGGTLNVTGAAGIAGSVINNGGFVNVSGAAGIGGTVTNSGSLFALAAGGDVTNTGTLGLPASSPIGSTFAINGSLSSTGATAVIDIRANGALVTPVADVVAATGTATIDSASTIHLNGTGNITTPIPIITSTTPLTVLTLPNVTSGLLFQPTLLFGPGNTSIELTAVQIPVGTFAQTPNERAAAVPIDQATANPAVLKTPQQQAEFSTLLGAFNQLKSGSQVASGLEALTAENLQYSRTIAFENSTFLAQRVDGVLANLRSGYVGLDSSGLSIVDPSLSSGLGRSMQSLLAYNAPYHPAAPNGVNYYPGGESGPNTEPQTTTPVWDSATQTISDSPNPAMTTAPPSSLKTPALSEFVSGDVVLADLNRDTGAVNSPSSKASYVAGSATAGVSFRMTSNLAAGVLFDYNHTDAKTDSNGSKMVVNSYSPGAYATFFDHGFYINGLASFGYNTYSNTRNIPFLGKTANSSPSGEQYVANLTTGYDFHPTKQWVVGPTVGATYTHLDVDSFTESGAPGADLSVRSQSLDSLRSHLGGHLSYQTNTGDVLLQPNLSIMWQHEFLNDASSLTSSYDFSPGNEFNTQSIAPGKDSALIGLGLTATLNTSMTLYLNYLADVGATDYFAQSIVGGLKARF